MGQTSGDDRPRWRLGRQGLEAGCGWMAAPAIFVDSVLRGFGQVMLQESSYAGLLFLIGITCNSWLFAVAALLGAMVSTATAMMMGAGRAQIRAGLFGFNGSLVGIALLYFLQPDVLTWGCVILAAACSTIVTAALTALLAPWKVSALTAPFVVTSLCFFLAVARFGRLRSTDLLPTAGLPQSAAIVEGVVDGQTIVDGLLNGLGQIFFQENPWTGVLFAAGLLIASRRALLMAMLGSGGGLLVAWGMGAAEPAIHAGAFGFNSALTAIALGCTFAANSRQGTACAMLGAVVTPFVFATVSAALEPLGMPALTLPFVLTTWLFLFAGRVWHSRPDMPATPA